MKTPQKQAPKWRPGGRGCGGEQDLTATCPARGLILPPGLSPRQQAWPGLRGWSRAPRAEAEVGLAFLAPEQPSHSAGSLRYHPPPPPGRRSDTRVCLRSAAPLGGGAGSLVNGRTVSPRSRRPVRVGPEEPLGVCKAGRPAVQPQALQAGTFHPKSPATGAGRAAEGTGPRGHALGSPARASQRFLVENSFMLFSEPINSVLSMNLTRCDVCFCDS